MLTITSEMRPFFSDVFAMALGKELISQDNRITHCPIFVVERRRRIVGFDVGFTDHSIIYDMRDCEPVELSPKTADRCRRIKKTKGEFPAGVAEFGYIETWEFVTACFTEKACHEYLQRNGHNLGETRIYVYSAYRNDEWESARNYFIKQSQL